MFAEMLLTTALSLSDEKGSVGSQKPGTCVSREVNESEEAVCDYSLQTLYENVSALTVLRDGSFNAQSVRQVFGLTPAFLPTSDQSSTVFAVKVSTGSGYATVVVGVTVWLPPSKPWVPSGWPANAPLPVVSKFGEVRMQLSIIDPSLKSCVSYKSLKSSARRYGWRGKTEPVQVWDGLSYQSLELHRGRSSISIREEQDGCVHELSRTVEFDPVSVRR